MNPRGDFRGGKRRTSSKKETSGTKRRCVYAEGGPSRSFASARARPGLRPRLRRSPGRGRLIEEVT
eukprot:6923535-Pyramimonas_sp.AAC.1